MMCHPVFSAILFCFFWIGLSGAVNYQSYSNVIFDEEEQGKPSSYDCGLIKREIPSGYTPVNAVYGSPSFHNGFFAAFFSVLGFIDDCEKSSLDGYCVDFQDQGSYYEPSMGKNWWSYYFEPLCTMPATVTSDRVVQEDQKMHFSFNILFRNRAEVNEIISKYIKIQPEIWDEVENCTNKLFQSAPVIGVNYLRQEKLYSSYTVNYSQFFVAIERLLKTPEFENGKIFVSTDEEDFLNKCVERYGDKVVYRNIPRHQSDTLLKYTTMTPNYDRGFDELVECLMLSRCEALIRTNTHLSVAASFFNPTAKFITVRTTFVRQ